MAQATSVQRRARMILIATAVLPVLVLGFLAVEARSWIDDLETRLQDRHDVLARLAAMKESARSGAQPAQPAMRQALSGDFLPGEQDSIVAAELQNRLRSIALAHGVEMNSANTLPLRKLGSQAFVGLRVSFRGQLGDIQQIAHAIETEKPFLFIERYLMRVDSWPMRSDDPEKDGQPAMVADIDIYGAKSQARGESGKPVPVPAPAAGPAPVGVSPVPMAPGRIPSRTRSSASNLQSARSAP